MKVLIDLKQYISPETESSVYKDIPIDKLETVKKILNHNGFTGKYRIKYRGPREDILASYCIKRKAKRFAIYEK